MLVVHERECLGLGLEAGDDLAGVHSGLDDLERDPAADGRLLLGHVDNAHSPFADFLQQFVGTMRAPGPSRIGRNGAGPALGATVASGSLTSDEPVASI